MSHTVYLKVELKNDNDKERLKEMLEFANLKSHEIFNYSSEVFFSEEAELRLEMYEDNNDMELINESDRKSVLASLSEAFFEDSEIIDSERLDELTLEVVEENSTLFRKSECESLGEEWKDDSVFVDVSGL